LGEREEELVGDVTVIDALLKTVHPQQGHQRWGVFLKLYRTIEVENRPIMLKLLIEQKGGERNDEHYEIDAKKR
jgi:hypothetical protein